MRRLVVLFCVVAIFAACQDSIIKYLGPENSEILTLLTDSLRFQAEDLDNVTDTREWIWQNTGPQALVHHNSFVHHGRGQLTIMDAAGDTVYSRIPLEWELESATDSGQAGNWTVKLELFGARGRVDFSVVRAP